MLRKLIPLSLLALLLVPAAAFASSEEGNPEYVTEFFIGLIVLIIALFAVIAGFEARRSGRRGSH